MKTILVPTEQNSSMVSALDTALLLAQKFGSCIEGFALRPAVADLVAMDPDSGLTMVAVKENDAEMVRHAEDLFRSFMTQHQVGPQSGAAGNGCHFLLAQFRTQRPRFRRKFWPYLRLHRIGAARRRMAEPVDGHTEIGPV